MADKPCERCGAVDKSTPDNLYGDEYQDDSVPAMNAEVHVSFGLVAWLCHDCRKEYHRFAKDHPLNMEYGEAALRLEFWKIRCDRDDTPDDAIEKGIELWKKVEELELKINESANAWLISDPDDRRTR